ncbi:DEAD/DEAH box helicase [Thalassotalea sp. HSM 43]|uniref:DEAD/DEAH box helicase n=1 Tax=Thalassotalea sp. HSM 43 TaxID=2552945 RepID=UPI001081B7A8|nr:DEAD/DEAH box helicase [Thalassotalea sp. HSM 43]QBY03283.1 DEAD/DEAH box helicase [Thalassotalea sp. HSM 43]
MAFEQFKLDQRLLKAVNHLGFEKPTDIQLQAIPAAMQGNDLIASSKTGSGKTLAFLLPAVQRLIRQRALSKKDPRVLILAPTRELAKQVFMQLRTVTAGTRFKSALILGGENFNDQVKVLDKYPDIVVATPGRLADHLAKGLFYLNGLELLILDEADRMLDMGFAEQLKQINLAADHRKRQTLMFSATLDHEQINIFANDLLKNPKRIAIGAITSEHKDINQRLVLADHLDHKQALLEHFLQHENYQQVIIFTATRSDTERLAEVLNKQQLDAIGLSGELKQSERNRIMESFAKGQHKILVTTDLASRGLDLTNVSHVFNFDMPKHPEEYVHRIGRTGRAGAKGDAISFVGPKDWYSYLNVKAFLQQDMPFISVEGLTAKFTGLKPKKTVSKKAPSKKAQDAKVVKKKAPKVKKKVTFVDEGFADLPMTKKKVGKLVDRDEEET